MIQDKLICHASGDFSKPFILGFYLYHIVQDKENQRAGDYFSPLGNLQSFENEWVEVEIRAPKGWCEPSSPGSFPLMSSPMTIPSCDTTTVDESNVAPFLKDELDIADMADEHGEWQVPSIQTYSSRYRHKQ